MSGSSMEPSVFVEKDGNCMVVWPLMVFIECWGNSENAFVANNEDDRDGTYRQFRMIMHFPLDVAAFIKPCPNMGAVVLPSARVTEWLFAHGVN